MFRSLTRLFILSLSLIVYGLGCSDDSSPASNNSPSKNIPFSITSLSSDSLYWGEWVSINGSGFGEDSNALKLFLYFTDLKFSLMTPKTIFFQVPPNSETGKLRLYKGDSLAQGTLTLHILPKNIHGFSPSATHFQPTLAKPGDKITIYGTNFPMRHRDFLITLNDLTLPIDSFNNVNLISHIPQEARSGELMVTLMGRVFPLGKVTIE